MQTACSFFQSTRVRDFDSYRALPQLQTCQTDQRQDHRDDPEADDDLGFGPAEFLEMVVDRRHQENALAGHFVVADLDDHREGFHDEETSYDGEDDLVFGGNRDGSERSAQRE